MTTLPKLARHDWVEAGLEAKAASSHTHTPSEIFNFTEVTQDIVGAMVEGAGGSYNDANGTITLPSGGSDIDEAALLAAYNTAMGA